MWRRGYRGERSLVVVVAVGWKAAADRVHRGWGVVGQRTFRIQGGKTEKQEYFV